MLGRALAGVFAEFQPILWDKEDLDITDPEAVSYKLKAITPDVIINCAAYNDVDGAEDAPEMAYKVNGEAVESLADAANQIGAILVYYSTAYVFDGKNRDGYKEDAKPAPSSIYGKSKLQGEHGAARAKRHYILRLDRLFGEPGAGKKSFVDKILEAALVQRQLKIIDEEEGCPTYSLDLAQQTKYILENNLPYGIYHTTNSGSCTWFGFAEKIFKIAGIGVELIPVSSEDVARKALRPKYSILLNTKLPPMRSWQDALEEYLSGVR